MFIVDQVSRIVLQFQRAWFKTFVFHGVNQGGPNTAKVIIVGTICLFLLQGLDPDRYRILPSEL